MIVAMSRLFAVTLTILALALSGCIKSGQNVAPADPPQITVLKYVQLADAADNAAAHELVALCVPAPGAAKAALDAQTCSDVKGYLVTVVGVLAQVRTEAASADPWSTMRVKIGSAVATATINATVSDPNLKSEIVSLQSLLTQILGVQ